MADSAILILTAAQTKLKATPEIAALVGNRVHGGVPANPIYPYIRVSCSSVPFATDDGEGMDHTLRVQAFARENKPAMVLKVRAAVFNSLNRQEAALGVTMIEHDGMADAFPDGDGRTYQSIIEFLVRVD